MKSTLLASLVLGMIAMPAFAGEGAVPQSTLKSVGLEQMQVLSDADGMLVRGKASFASSATWGVASGTLISGNGTSSYTTVTGSSSGAIHLFGGSNSNANGFHVGGTFLSGAGFSIGGSFARTSASAN